LALEALVQLKIFVCRGSRFKRALIFRKRLLL
jgi:hypothetical protein